MGRKVLRGEVYTANLDGIVSSNSMQKGVRPVIVVSNNKNNKYSPNVTVIALTTSMTKSKLPTHVEIKSTGRDSIALCECITTIDKELLGDLVARCTPREMIQVNMSMITQLGIDVVQTMKEFAVEMFDFVRGLNDERSA